MKLIYVSGIDGCGKTTQSKLLNEYLNSRSIKSSYQWLRWSPSIGKIISFLKKRNEDKHISNSIEDEDAKVLENESFSKWSKIKSSLFNSLVFRSIWFKYCTWDYYFSYKNASSGWNTDVIILDRYYFDFIVDQSLNYNMSAGSFDKKVKSGILGKIKQPDLFILIDISPEIGWDRKRDGTSMKHLRKLSAVYDISKNDNNVHIVDGSNSVQNIHEQIVSIVSNKLGNI